MYLYCTKCGTQNPENAKVCSSCSQSLSVLPDVPPPVAKTSALAIWSFVLALVGLFTSMITALPALICGIVGLVKISRSNGRLKGKGLAIAGIVITVVFTIFILLAILMPALGKVRQLSQRIMCGTNLSGLETAIMVYATDHNDMYPPADSWCDVLIKDCNISPRQFCCPASNAIEGKSSYAINVNVAGKKVSEIPPDTVLLFETTPAVNPAGTAQILSTDNHQGDGCNILFVDGHAKFVKTPELSTLHWTLE